MDGADAQSVLGDAQQQFVCIRSFWFPDDATLACTALESLGIVSYLQNDRVLTAVWAWNIALGGIRLMIPEQSAALAESFFQNAMSESRDHTSREDENHRSGIGSRYKLWMRAVLALSILFSPVASPLMLLVVAR